MVERNILYLSKNGEVLTIKDIVKIGGNFERAGSIEYDIENEEAILCNLMISDNFLGKGWSRKLRDKAIQLILSSGISKIITFPYSYNDNFPTEKLEEFYVKNFKENGAKEILITEGTHSDHKLTAIF